ncbi:hypothetical protein ACNFU2_10915 [Chryseobacterium sp. PTM-20240506]|uniref:hypothetical protein n=1 Tax=unclassified Chryseobacterium TaxID=2593645 RepID=UPI002358FDF1|nr:MULTISPECIES: hypothetical protein [unclassified Chryseobacterium]MDC8105406.1 hypothetical protein [Chryseobacterium sp. B21-037]MDQ1805661.1 hypothetical protein [Chryseobacterium sp. CKR4-1]
MRKIFWVLIVVLFTVSCSKSKKQEETELNKIVSAVLKYESNRNPSKENPYLVDPKLLQLKIYTPSPKEMLGEEPGPPPFFNKSVVHLLDLKNSKSGERKSDSLHLLIQNKYILDSLKIDDKINSNIRLAHKEEVDHPIKLYQFSNPLYFNDRFAYIEYKYHDTSFVIGFGYLLEKQKDGSWEVKRVTNTFMT